MQLTKYRTIGKNIPDELANASKISKLLKEIESNDWHPVSYMKASLLNDSYVVYNGLISVKQKGAVWTPEFLNTPQFKEAILLTNRPKIKAI